jgi:D-glucosaminate-6-phosphate ammonia-lyase
LGLRPIINVSGTMTALGASIIVPEASQAMAKIAPQSVEMDELHLATSKVVALLTASRPASSRPPAPAASRWSSPAR